MTTLVERIEALAEAISLQLRDVLESRSEPTIGLSDRLDDLQDIWTSGFRDILASYATLRDVVDTLDTTERAALEQLPVIPTSAAPVAGSRLPPTFRYGVNGINAHTGKAVTGWEHVAQSIFIILTTPIGSRVMRRDFGSRCHSLMDRPMTIANILEVYLAVAEALDLWEPRFKLRFCRLIKGTPQGHLSLAIYGIYFPRGHLGDFTVSYEPDAVLVQI